LTAVDLWQLRELAQTAAELADNRVDPDTSEEYVDPALLERIYAEAVADAADYLLGGEDPDPQGAFALVLRAGRRVGDEPGDG
jgi:hypothetical protein